MSHAMRIGAIGAIALTTLLAGRSAAAAEQESVSAATPVLLMANMAQTAAVPAAANPLGVKPLDAKRLANRRGGTDVFNDMQLKGVVADNRATNVSTGNNAIMDGAFSGTSGLPMVVQNSGNNVLIQNATIVNVQVK